MCIPIGCINAFMSHVVNDSYSEKNQINEIGTMLSVFGTGIYEFHLVEVPIEKVVSNMPKDLMKDISDTNF